MGETPDIKLSQLGQITLSVGNLEAAKDFYGRVLGLKHLFSMPNLVFFDCGGVRLMLSLPEGEDIGRGGSVLYFQVESIQAAHASLSARGLVFTQAPHLIAKMGSHDLWMAFFRDPFDNLMAIMAEEKPG